MGHPCHAVLPEHAEEDAIAALTWYTQGMRFTNQLIGLEVHLTEFYCRSFIEPRRKHCPLFHGNEQRAP